MKMHRVLAVIIVIASAGWAFDGVDGDSEWDINLLAPLAVAGVKVDDEAALISALHRADVPGIAVAAAYALGKLPRSEAIVSELNAAALSKDEFLMTYSIRSLLKFGDRQWVDSAAVRFPGLKRPLLRLELAWELAAGGRYDGWEIVQDAIVNGDRTLQITALSRITAFQGMKDASGKPVNLVVKLDELMQKVPPERRLPIFQTINQIGTDQRQPARTAPQTTRPKR
jgi:hypothetical protein